MENRLKALREQVVSSLELSGWELVDEVLDKQGRLVLTFESPEGEASIVRLGVMPKHVIEQTIPDITDSRIAVILNRVKPVVETKPGYYREVVLVDPRGMAFLWDPKLVGEPLRLKALRRVRTYHTWGSPALFKPSLAEVCAFLQNQDLEGATHFCLEADDGLHKPDACNSSGYHSGVCTLLGPR